MPNSKTENERLAVLETKCKALEEGQKNYVTKEAFAPVQLLVYGFATLILSSFVGAFIMLVIKK